MKILVSPSSFGKCGIIDFLKRSKFEIIIIIMEHKINRK